MNGENFRGDEFKRLMKWGSVAVVVLAIFLGVQTLIAFKNLRGINPSYNSISVSGQGEVVAIPDVATFSFNVSADASSVASAQSQVTEKMDAILAELEELGIAENDIKTTDYSVYPKYTYEAAVCLPTYCPPGRQIQNGYTANHGVSVKVRDTEQAGTALSVAGDNGATGLSNISFTIDKPEEILDEARALAIADAKARAEVLADELGVRLVRVVSFYEDGPSPMPQYYAMEGRGSADNAVSSVPALPVGENKTAVSVTVVYEIR